MNRFLKRNILAATIAMLAMAGRAGDLTAFDLIKEGNKHVGEDARDKVVQIRSEKSVGTLMPNIWYVVYYDPDATFKATEVKFGAGKKMDVKRPARVFETMTGEKALDPKKLKIDSPKALDAAKDEPLIANIKLTNAQMFLEKRDDEPVWKVKLWAQKLRNPNATADIGEIFVSAETGKVVRNNLHPERVD